MEEVTWTVGGQPSAPEGKKMAYVSPWGKLTVSDEEKGKLFNAMRGALIAAGLMDNAK